MEKYYYELTIKTRKDSLATLLDMISILSDEALEFDDEKVIIRSENDPGELMESLGIANSKLQSPIKMDLKLEKKENVDWIGRYRDSIQPIRAGRFYIRPEWHPPIEGAIDIVINPALAFGSGHHATTHSCLEAVGDYVSEGNTLLDVGCGSGILALAAAKLGALTDICDTDPLAVESAVENFGLNGEKYRRAWTGSAQKSDAEYDIVIANIVADILKAISTHLIKRIAEGGILIVSGILDKKESIVTDSFKDMTLLDRKQRDEWVTLIYKKDVNGQSTR